MAAQASKIIDDSRRVAVARQLGARFGDRLVDSDRRRGRGASSNPSGRLEAFQRETIDDGWTPDEAPEPLQTEVTVERPRSIITRNESPDISFDQSINPYRGCEHGCFYCFARLTHAYQGLSAGLDFESRLFVKDGAAALQTLTAQPVHLVISDMNMPGLDGLGLLRRLRENRATARIGFILITGSADKTLIERGRQFSLNNYVTKPFTVAQLRGAIEAVVGKLS